MKKTTIKKVLALVVGVLIIAASLTAGFSVAAETYPEYYGNEAGNGFNSYTNTAKGTSSWPFNLKPADDIYNLDFQNDFWFWSGHDCSDGLGSIGGRRANRPFDLITDGDNKYAQMKSPYYCDILTALFTAKNVAVGDKLVVIYDAKGADATKIRAFVRQVPIKKGITYDETTGENNSADTEASPKDGVVNLSAYDEVEPTEFAVQNSAADWTTYILGNVDTVKDFGAEDSTLLSDIYLQVKVDAPGLEHKVTEVDAAIDNIRIAKVKNGVYTDVATNEVIYTDPNASDDDDDNNNGNQGGTTAPSYPAYYGTEDKGFDANTVASYKLKPNEGIFSNLDFSDGFICWSGSNKVGADGTSNPYASDCYDLVTEANGNKYVKVKDSGYVISMRSIVFSVDGVEAGDSITVLYDVKGNDGGAFGITLKQAIMKADRVYDETTGISAAGVYSKDHNVVGSGVAASDFDVNLGADGWTTRAGYKNVKVQELAADGSDKYYFQVIITCGDAGGAVAGDKLDAAIDNLRIVKVKDGVYTDLADGKVLYDPNAPVGGDGGDDNQGGNDGTGNNGSGNGSATTGDSVLALAALFFISGAAVFGTAKAMKNR